MAKSEWVRQLTHVNKDIRPLMESEKIATPFSQFQCWVGAELAVVNWVAGAVPVALGLSLIDACIAIIIGGLIGCLFFAALAVMGKTSGCTQMVLGRMPYGRKGSYIPAILNVIMQIGWPGILTFVSLQALVMIFKIFGVSVSIPGQILIAIIIFALQTWIPASGHKIVTKSEGVMMWVMLAAGITLTVVLITQGIPWNHPASGIAAEGGIGRMAVFTGMFAAMGVCWAIAWCPNTADYFRNIPHKSKTSNSWWAGYFGMLSSVWLLLIGAITAAKFGAGVDPAEAVLRIAPNVFIAVCGLCIICIGCISTNAISTYSGIMSAMNSGIKWSRKKICWILFGGIPFIVTLVFIFKSDLATIMDNWMLSLIFLIMPWISIVLVDYFIIRKQRINMRALYMKTDDPDDYGDWNKGGIISLIAGYAVGALFAVTSVFTGPIAIAMGGIDICWIVQLVVTSALYYILANKRIQAIYANAPPYQPEEIDISAINL